MRRCASADCAAATAAGAASDSAQGHVATSTAMALGSACDGSTNHQPTTVATVMPSTAHRNQPAIRLALSTMCGRSRPASSTSRCRAASEVDAPMRVTSTTSGWSRLIEPARIGAPLVLSIGVDSPVSQACEQLERPCTTTPSAGTVSPGGTSTRSPIFNCSAWIASVASDDGKATSRSAEIVECRRAASMCSRADASPRASTQRDASTSAMNIVTESK